MNGLDLFSGIGGLSLALKPWVSTIAYVESDRYAQGVLLSRMRDGSLDVAPIWDDVRTLRGQHLDIPIDIIFGGFPCQDISVAGAGRGMGGERSGLYTHIERLVEETKPAFVFLENVPAIRTRGLGRVVWGLSSLGYDCRWTVISAASVGAPHKRDRWFLLAANTDRLGLRDRWERGAKRKAKTDHQPRNNGEKESLANAEGFRLKSVRDASDASLQRTDWAQNAHYRSSEKNVAYPPGIGSWSRAVENKGPRRKDDFMRVNWWSTEPNVGRVAHGIPQRVDRVRCLGNAVVPLQAREAFEILIRNGGVK